MIDGWFKKYKEERGLSDFAFHSLIINLNRIIQQTTHTKMVGLTFKPN